MGINQLMCGYTQRWDLGWIYGGYAFKWDPTSGDKTNLYLITRKCTTLYDIGRNHILVLCVEVDRTVCWSGCLLYFMFRGSATRLRQKRVKKNTIEIWITALTQGALRITISGNLGVRWLRMGCPRILCTCFRRRRLESWYQTQEIIAVGCKLAIAKPFAISRFWSSLVFMSYCFMVFGVFKEEDWLTEHGDDFCHWLLIEIECPRWKTNDMCQNWTVYQTSDNSKCKKRN